LHIPREEQHSMLGSGFKAEHLRVNLRLVINQLAQKARKEIADYLAAGKDERARIRVEHIIREDYLVEAMEILELYCDLLLAQFGLIQSMKELDSGLAESVSTLIWALCRTNQIGTVNDRLMHNLSVEAPSKILVERYLIEIAKNYNTDLIDVGFTDDVKKGGPGRGGGGGFTAPVGRPDGMVPMPMPMPMPMPSANTPFSYPLPKGPSDFSGLPMGTYQAFPNIYPSQIPATPPSYESVDDINADKNISSAQIVGPGPKPEASAKLPS
uniref:IST1 homolog n=1 Tax=Gorilla gorilla gorilla TaxID=9595 RepID=A0A2I2YNM6_GORGO